MPAMLEYESRTGLRPAVALPLLIAALTLAYYLILKPIYNITFHPLRRYPGPKLWAMSRIPFHRAFLSGFAHKRILELHEQYGDIVRIAPDQLSYNSPEAWKDIMGHRKNGSGENGKDPVFYQSSQGSIIGSDKANHSRYRRILSHGFSAQSMLDQQPLICSYVDLFIRRMHETSDGGTKPIDIAAWFNYTTFDIIGDLAFGEPFDCLRLSDYHPWIALIFASIKQMAMITSLRRFFGNIDSVITTLRPSAVSKRREHAALVKAKVDRRLARTDPRPDFMDAMLRKDTQQKLTRAEIDENSRILIIAGSETTATALSGAVFYLGNHPDVLEKLATEVRTSFTSEDEIDLLSVQKLKYVTAVIEEALRMYPPVASALPRRTQPGGDYICGKFVPEGTILDIWQWPTYRNPRNFTLPNEFIPERWLDDPRFANDRKDCFQPFSHGPRNCIGKNLAYAEMRLLLSRLIWNFDLKLDEASKDWMENNRLYTFWQKGPLNIYLTPRKIE